jgi:hypothetical protein
MFESAAGFRRQTAERRRNTAGTDISTIPPHGKQAKHCRKQVSAAWQHGSRMSGQQSMHRLAIPTRLAAARPPNPFVPVA